MSETSKMTVQKIMITVINGKEDIQTILDVCVSNNVQVGDLGTNEVVPRNNPEKEDDVQ